MAVTLRLVVVDGDDGRRRLLRWLDTFVVVVVALVALVVSFAIDVVVTILCSRNNTPILVSRK